MPSDPRANETELLLAKAVADESRDGIILCDSSGTVIHANAVANALLSDAHAAGIHRISLAAVTLGERQREQLNGFFVTARPLSLENAEPIAIVTVRPNAHHPCEESIRARFSLSRREAQVAVLLADRRTDAEIAAALGISWHTVRTHVERIFAALECHTRRDAALKLTSPD